MNTRRKVVQGLFWSLFQSGGNYLITFVVFVCLARLLKPVDFGLVALASVFIAALQLFINIGFADAIIQRKNLEPAHLDTAYWTILAIGGVCTVSLMSMAEWLALLFKKPELASVLRWLSLNIFFASLTRVQEAVLARDFNFKVRAVRIIIGAAIGGAVGVGMALSGYGVWSLVSQQLLSSIIGVAILWGSTPWRPSLHYSIAHLKDMFGFGMHVTGINIMHFINTQTDRLLIGYFLGSTALGYYTVGMRLINIIEELLVRTFMTVLFPLLSRIQDDKAQLKSVFSRAGQLVALIIFPAFVFLSVAGQEAVQVLFGSHWSESGLVIQILALGGLLHSITIFNDPLFKSKGKPAWVLRIGIARALLSVLLFVLAVHWGIIAVATSWVIRAALLIFFSLWLIRRLIALDILTYLYGFRGPSLAGIAMAIGILVTKNVIGTAVSTPVLLITELAVACIVYITVILLADINLFKKAIATVRSGLPKKSIQSS